MIVPRHHVLGTQVYERKDVDPGNFLELAPFSLDTYLSMEEGIWISLK